MNQPSMTLGADYSPRATLGKRFLGSFLSALVGWITATIVLFAYTCAMEPQHSTSSYLNGFLSFAIVTGAFVFSTWLVALLPLYLFLPLRSPLWHWPTCTLCGGLAGGAIMLIFLWPTKSNSFPLVIFAALSGATTCFFGSVTASHFQYDRNA